MLRSLVGSEMCIRDSCNDLIGTGYSKVIVSSYKRTEFVISRYIKLVNGCLLYTSDAADDLLCVDLGGRRIIKKKKTTTT